MNQVRRAALCGCALILFAFSTTIEGQDRRRPGTFLTGPARGEPLEIALDYLRQVGPELGLADADLAALTVRDRTVSRHNQTTHLHLRQSLHGIEVVNGQVDISLAADGSIIQMRSSLVPNLAAAVNTSVPELAAETAVRRAAEQLGLAAAGRVVELEGAGGAARAARFDAPEISRAEIPARLVFYATAERGVRLAWDLVIHQRKPEHLWNLWIDAVSGALLGRSDWIANDSYQVYALPKESPSDGPRTIESNPADLGASPFGWHDTNGSAGAEFTDTRGNNVSAQEDRDANNSGGFRPSGGAGLDFSFPLDLNQNPVDYQSAAIANLFYWNNILHDVLYQYGFDDASGNFQENNYGRGGAGGDSVRADAQDGSDTNNANFATPPEGGPFDPHPRMQMFEWLPPNDHEVVIDPPSSAAGSYVASGAAFGPALSTTGISGAVKLANDGVGVITDGCESFSGGFFSGQIALIDRGTCSFVTKVRNAQNAGATAVIVANNSGGNPIVMGDDGTGGDIVIAAVMVSQADGTTIRNGLPASGTVRRSASPPPNRDSDLDSGVIAHEYCHGLSNRLTGGPTNSNCLTGNQQAGEGWSDFCTLFLTPLASDTETTARGVGTYLVFEPPTGLGIRPFPYTTDINVNPLTYGDLVTAGQAGGLSIPHGVGTVWATALWEMYWNLVGAHGFDANLYSGSGGNNLAMQLVVDGLKLQGCNPTFLDARDAILLADQNNGGGANRCLIWEAFAKRGMGVGAGDGGNSNSLNVTEDFSLPPECVQGCGNGICESGEDCTTCPSDCVSGTSAGAVCGNGLCETADGENCLSCAADCRGVQSGKPANRFCCGDGTAGQNPVTCADARCTSGGFSCTTTPAPGGGSFCCGDLMCDPGEGCGNCGLDCALGFELCSGGVDEDCDGQIDCADLDCLGAPACQSSCGNGICEPGEDCHTCNDCPGKLNGPPSGRYCCGDGVAQPPEGNGSICDGNF